MFKIVRKQKLAPDVCLFELEAPKVAEKRKAGQFVIIKLNETGERIPLTIADSDPNRGTITLVVQSVGKTTHQLNQFSEGESIQDVVGPLGKATEIEGCSLAVPIGGGIGIAVAYPIAAALKQAGVEVISIIGARTKELLFFEEKMRTVSDKLYISTDDGSYGVHGFVTDILKQLLESERVPDRVFAIGPLPMMRAVCKTTLDKRVSTVVSLNPIMVDGTGMCGACRVTVDNNTRFVCVHGPEFDGHEVDWVELMKRQRMYCSDEKRAMELFREKNAHRCGGQCHD
ncbi:sulfide/dihydroorotate dehydrogenase-like FAD/NAD-binding protein [bacterium]|nr:sulfide/dihydroorotate dehydrogenase-like FAD/NAD-binding protein [bacterium]